MEASRRGEGEPGVGEQGEEVSRTGEKEQLSRVSGEWVRLVCKVHV